MKHKKINDDGNVWCSKCGEYISSSYFCTNKNGEYRVYCKFHENIKTRENASKRKEKVKDLVLDEMYLEETKECFTCKIVKKMSEFNYKKDRGKFEATCKQCISIRISKHLRENRDKINERRRLTRKKKRDETNKIT